MHHLLTIAIPTYNRAEKLDQQLGRLSTWSGDLASIALRVHDNASTDETRAVVEKWRLTFGQRLTYHRHSENRGLIGNYLSCIDCCETSYVWVVGDDDVVHESGAAAVLRKVHRYYGTGMFALNYRPVDGLTGRPLKDTALPVDLNRRFPDAHDFVEACQRYEYGCLMFITAVVLHVDSAREIIKKSNIAVTNLALPLYIHSAVAATGGGHLVEDVVFDGLYGVGTWKDREFEVFFLHVPLVLEQLILKHGLHEALLDRYLARFAITLFKPGRRMLTTPIDWYRAVRVCLRLLKLKRDVPR